MWDDGRVGTNFSLSNQSFSVTTRRTSKPFIYFIHYNILYTMSKRSREDTFDSDSSDDEYFLESDKMEDDDIASDSGSEIRTSASIFPVIIAVMMN
ncbi:hypothetical protein WH47_01661 [Habropoda laboriosa]|uniref:Uncharacterized protein n=1 Tax=Habropoda laboriosa TaxID=597456 RepID=A0A0L7R4E3_9HYME|nr:hypothetical protein WH47_01661 [Habropoda laboriosa]